LPWSDPQLAKTAQTVRGDRFTRISCVGGFSKLVDFQQAHCQWIEAALHGDLAVLDARWSEAIAVGSLAFVEKIKGELEVKALHREVEQ
jgi:hypothetical protein